MKFDVESEFEVENAKSLRLDLFLFVTGGYQNKKIGKNRKGLTFLRAFEGKL